MRDFVIIGGGIAGCSSAARLSELGSVTLLESEQGLGYHATGRSAALFEENYGSASTIALNRASKLFLQESDVLSPRGFLMVAHAHEDAEFNETLEELKMHEISVGDAVGMVPIIRNSIARAAYFGEASDIDVDKLLQTYARLARNNGATILTNSPVVAIAKTTFGWTVETKGETIEARILVNAAGAWADEIAEMAGAAPIGLTPYRRSMARIPAPGGHDLRHWPMLFGPGETWYAKPDAGKLLVSPADEDATTPHDAWADDMVLAEGLARYEEHVTTPVTRVEHSWAGLRTFSPDRSLVIGLEPSDPSFLWVAGQGGYGIQSSAAYSQLAADLVAGKPSDIDSGAINALSPARFRQ